LKHLKRINITINVVFVLKHLTAWAAVAAHRAVDQVVDTVEVRAAADIVADKAAVIEVETLKVVATVADKVVAEAAVLAAKERLALAAEVLTKDDAKNHFKNLLIANHKN
jgi:hypothetical protein